MPWYKEAVINAESVIRQLQMEDKMDKELQYLRKIMVDKGWDAIK